MSGSKLSPTADPLQQPTSKKQQRTLLQRDHAMFVLLCLLLLLIGMQYAAGAMMGPGNTPVSIMLTYLNASSLRRGGSVFPLARALFNVTDVATSSGATLNLSAFDFPTTRAILNESHPLCPVLPPKLVGPLAVQLTPPSWEQMEKRYSNMEPGGWWRPENCTSRHRVAIIIPYRDREPHLRIFLNNMHAMLQRQQLDYAIYVIEEIEGPKFNRAKLFNTGFVEALKRYPYQCFIFHDVDLIPEDDGNIYSCPESPRHMSVAIDRMRYRLPYNALFGGAGAISRKDFLAVNGFSNQFWGWGAEDDDMYNRLSHAKLKLIRYPAYIARYKMLKHAKDKADPDRYKILYSGKTRFASDGLSSLDYVAVRSELRPLYTWSLVDIGQGKNATLIAQLARSKAAAMLKTKTKK